MREAARYRHRVFILEPIREKSATGQDRVVRWATVGYTWAEVVPKMSREFSAMSVRHESMTALYHLRGPLALQPDFRLQHDGRQLEILGMATEGNMSPKSAVEISVYLKELP